MISLTTRRSDAVASGVAARLGIDPLTGLPGRATLADWEDGGEALPSSAILVLDLDGLRSLNRSFGYSAGDRVLRSVAVRLVRLCPLEARIFRMGEDEFAVVLPGADEPRARTVFNDLRRALAASHRVAGLDLHVACSAGIAMHAGIPARPGAGLAQALEALADAKREGGGAWRHYRPGTAAPIQPVASSSDLLRAWHKGEWELHYQPQFLFPADARSGVLAGAEALLRWRHPIHGLLSPGAFLASLKVHHTVDPVGRWIMETACRDLAAWRAAGLRIPCVGINLFAPQLRDRRLPADVASMLGRYGLSAGDLALEITEDIAIEPNRELVSDFKTLRQLGVPVMLDDFGTGFAGLSTLAKLALSGLKIDRSFVEDMGEGASGEAVVKAILALGRDLRLDVIAEGVETAAQLDRLRELGCTRFQGYAFSAALPAGAFLSRYHNR